MVKTTKQGKERPFSRGLLLTIVTFGLYGIYWAYKAPKELFDQFELRREGRDDGVVWLVLGLVLPFLIFIYFWKAIENVRHIRTRLGLKEGISPLGFIGLNLAASVITLVVILGALGVGGVWAETATDPEVFLGSILAVMIAGFALGIVVQAYAYYRLQTDINDVWRAWAARVQELTTQDPGHRPPGAPAGEAGSESAPGRPGPDPLGDRPVGP